MLIGVVWFFLGLLWWGAILVGDEAACIEYESLINIRPGRNPGIRVEDEALRARIREVVFGLIGRGRPAT